jgi:hypothetical protein
MGKYDDLLTEESPSPTPTGKYADLLDDSSTDDVDPSPQGGKYADLLDASPPPSDTPWTDKALKAIGKTVSGLIPKTVGQAAEMMIQTNPAIGPVYDAAKKAYDISKGLSKPRKLQQDRRSDMTWVSGQ